MNVEVVWYDGIMEVVEAVKVGVEVDDALLVVVGQATAVWKGSRLTLLLLCQSSQSALSPTLIIAVGVGGWRFIAGCS